MSTYLTPEQVYQLNEKHGWFQFNDAQSDVSKAFAQDAIAMHEQMRAAAPEMYAALKLILSLTPDDSTTGWNAALNACAAAVAAAEVK